MSNLGNNPEPLLADNKFPNAGVCDPAGNGGGGARHGGDKIRLAASPLFTS